MLSFGVVADAVLFALGLYWCREMARRWRRDLSEFRRARDTSDRAAIGIVWALTVLIAVAMLNAVLALLARFGIL